MADQQTVDREPAAVITIAGVGYELRYQVQQCNAVHRRFPTFDPRTLIFRAGTTWVDADMGPVVNVNDTEALTIMLWACLWRGPGLPCGKECAALECRCSPTCKKAIQPEPARDLGRCQYTAAELLEQYIADGGSFEEAWALCFAAFTQGAYGRSFIDALKKKAQPDPTSTTNDQPTSPTISGSTDAATPLSRPATDPGSLSDSPLET